MCVGLVHDRTPTLGVIPIYHLTVWRYLVTCHLNLTFKNHLSSIRHPTKLNLSFRIIGRLGRPLKVYPTASPYAVIYSSRCNF